MQIRHRLGCNIRDIRRFRGFSQEILAAEACLSRAHIGRLENGVHGATLKTIGDIAHALDIDPVALLVPRWSDSSRLISLIEERGGYVDFFQEKPA